MYLLEKARVAGVPGTAFFAGSNGERFMRFCFAKTDDELEEASRRIERLE
jgi:aminotransferase